MTVCVKDCRAKADACSLLYDCAAVAKIFIICTINVLCNAYCAGRLSSCALRSAPVTLAYTSHFNEASRGTSDVSSTSRSMCFTSTLRRNDSA